MGHKVAEGRKTGRVLEARHNEKYWNAEYIYTRATVGPFWRQQWRRKEERTSAMIQRRERGKVEDTVIRKQLLSVVFL